MTIVVQGDEHHVGQVERQLFKLIDVVSVEDITDRPLIDRELALIKVRAEGEARSKVLELVEVFRADVVDVAEDSLIVQVLGDEDLPDLRVQRLGPLSEGSRIRRAGADRPRREVARFRHELAAADLRVGARGRGAAGADGPPSRGRAPLHQRLTASSRPV